MTTIGYASLRRIVAGNVWCAEKMNQGKYPCLCCRGRGTVEGEEVRVACQACRMSGYCPESLWQKFAVFWTHLKRTERKIDDQIFYS